MSVTAEKLHIVKQVDHIPSRKFIPLVYQIASRLSIPDVPGISPEQKHFRTSIHDVRAEAQHQETRAIEARP